MKRSGICSCDQYTGFQNQINETIYLSLVVVTPTGPLYIAINTSRTIYCSVPKRGYWVNWIVEYQDITISDAYDVPGFMIRSTETSSSLTINTTDISIVGCIAYLEIPHEPQRQRHIPLTIYGMLILYNPILE